MTTTTDSSDASCFPFRKMNGCGNDFVILDRRERALALTPALVRAIADRVHGVGCDQLITLETPRKGGDVFMGIYNRDGNPAEACGNATRCVAHLLMAETARDQAVVETVLGINPCTDAGDKGVRVDMGEPRFGWRDIPLVREVAATSRIMVDGIDGSGGISLPPGCAVNMGNPHIVFFVDNTALPDLDLARCGPLVEHHALFPERVNVSFAGVTGEGDIVLKVWERGAGATRACGTAACAALVAGVRRRLTGRTAQVVLPGGALDIEWREGDGHVFMTGPIAYDHDGRLDISRLMRDAAS